MGFITEIKGLFNICKSIHIIYHIKKGRIKSYDMIILTDVEKLSNKIQPPFTIKTLNEVDTKEQNEYNESLNITKTKYAKFPTNITLNGIKLKAFSLRSRTRQGCLLLPLLFNIVLKFSPWKLDKKLKKKKRTF